MTHPAFGAPLDLVRERLAGRTETLAAVFEFEHESHASNNSRLARETHGS